MSTIDFDFRREASGLVMVLTPATGEDTLNIPESAFGFVEPCVRAAWPAYANYGHWGRTTIPTASWREIVDCMQALRLALMAATRVADVEGIGLLFAHLQEEFDSDFAANRAGLVRLIDDVCAWLRIWIDRAIDVTIVGV